MTFRRDPADEPFYREWNAARAAEAGPERTVFRSRARSRLFFEALGLSRELPVPACLIVGSKGKGTAVAAAAKTLDRAGVRAGVITSPPHRHNRERIRIGGAAMSVEEYRQLSGFAAEVLDGLPPAADGYLPPSGMYTLAGIRWLLDAGVEALVVEEGLGGLSDEVSLFSYPAVGVTEIFEEHADVLGGSIKAIAADLLGVIDDVTERVVAFSPQPAEALALLDARTEWCAGGSFAQRNASVGQATARALVDVPPLPAEELLGELTLPGRMSLHRVGGAQWCVDTAISAAGVAAARAYAQAHLRPGFRVIAAFPDVKDVEGCTAELAGLPVVLAAAGTDYLRYTRSGAELTVAQAVQWAGQADVLAVGTQSFAAEVLERLRVPTDRWWQTACA